MEIKNFFDATTSTLTYVVYDDSVRAAVIIDPVLDYEPGSSRISTGSVEALIRFLKDAQLKPVYVLETHAHADHLSGAQTLKEFFPDIKVAVNEKIIEVQSLFKKIYNLSTTFRVDGSQFDCLLRIGETYRLGGLSFKVLSTPGHTPACSSFLVGEAQAVFTGDALFMPDYGTGRCDFPGGSAEQLYDSVMSQLYSLPDQTRIFVGHDYLPCNRPLKFESTIGQQKRENIRLNKNTKREDFIAFRRRRDAELEAPRLLYPSIQVNIRAGGLPEPEENGTRYLKIPIEMG